ncbi:MAG: 1-deoxy-D-xylulose-5-phosphate reductoisomerase [Proteobacteria bacterium]|nr:1-deoxy-D-xylulose-5-phosphate reductoisomerase [Pseudomonadota bacterium]
MKNSSRNVTVLGSTGSVGLNTLSVIRQNPGQFNIIGLSCNRNLKELILQIREFSPLYVSVGKGYQGELEKQLSGANLQVEVFEGIEGNNRLASMPNLDILVAAIVGAAGVEPVLSGIRAEKTIALANKEAIVLAGAILMREAAKRNVKILPIDSEHNAIFQSLMGNKKKDLDHITLTASGGPFRELPAEKFHTITLNEALNHPNWEMGPKITIDSATMMNKCLEIIEAKWLFDLSPEKIRVLVHPQSIIHSMVTYKDGSTICQMGTPNMRTPIANCLGYPDRIKSGSEFLNLADIGHLTFEKPNNKKFPTLNLAYDVLELGGGAPAALNGANENLVTLFLNGKISFLDIQESLQKVVATLFQFKNKLHIEVPSYLFKLDSLEDAISADHWGRNFVNDLFTIS